MLTNGRNQLINRAIDSMSGRSIFDYQHYLYNPDAITKLIILIAMVYPCSILHLAHPGAGVAKGCNRMVSFTLNIVELWRFHYSRIWGHSRYIVNTLLWIFQPTTSNVREGSIL